MRIVVFGAGAIGSVLGGFLAKAGHEVILLGRAWHLDIVHREGLRISGLWGEHRIRQIATATAIEQVKGGQGVDWIFVCVKAYQTVEVAASLPELLGPDTLVCAFQNGLGNYEALIQRVDPSRVVLGRVIFGAEIDPGHVRVTVCADEVLVGSPGERVSRPRIVSLAATLQAGGIPTRVTTSILTALWGKVLYNCALNGFSTLLEVPYGKLLERPPIKAVMHAVVEEAYRVAAAHRIGLDPSTPAAYRELLFARLIPDTAAHHPSMLQDLRRGRPTEIEALNGAIVRLAQQAGVPAPINALITRLIHAKERFLGV